MKDIIKITDGYNETLYPIEKIENISKTRVGMGYKVCINSNYTKEFTFEKDAEEFYGGIRKQLTHYYLMKSLPDEAQRKYDEIESTIEEMYQLLSDNNIPIPNSYYNLF